jgi:acyl carrier protein
MDAPLSREDIEGALYATLAAGRGSTVDAVRAVIGGRGQIDSLEGVELIVAAEESFGVSIGDDELSRVCRSVPNLAQLVESKVKQRQQKEARS